LKGEHINIVDVESTLCPKNCHYFVLLNLTVSAVKL